MSAADPLTIARLGLELAVKFNSGAEAAVDTLRNYLTTTGGMQLEQANAEIIKIGQEVLSDNKSNSNTWQIRAGFITLCAHMGVESAALVAEAMKGSALLAA